MSKLDEDAIIAAMVGRSLLDASHEERTVGGEIGAFGARPFAVDS